MLNMREYGIGKEGLAVSAIRRSVAKNGQGATGQCNSTGTEPSASHDEKGRACLIIQTSTNREPASSALCNTTDAVNRRQQHQTRQTGDLR